MATVALSGIITPTNVVTAASTTTLTNKTLTAPTIASANLTTALTLAGAAGTNGQVLTSAGSGMPTWSSPSSGAMTLISTQTASSSASLSWTGLSGYNSYMLILKNLKTSSGVDNFILVVGTGTTPTYVTSGYYYVGIGVNNTSTVTDSSLSASYISIDPGHVISSTDGLNASYTLSGFTSDNFALTGTATNYYNGSQANSLVKGGGLPSNTTAKTAIKINFLTANIGSGTASLYGISS